MVKSRIKGRRMAEPGDMPVRRCASYMCKKMRQQVLRQSINRNMGKFKV